MKAMRETTCPYCGFNGWHYVSDVKIMGRFHSAIVYTKFSKLLEKLKSLLLIPDGISPVKIIERERLDCCNCKKNWIKGTRQTTDQYLLL